MKTWQEIKAEIDRETLLTELEPAQDVLDVFRYSISKAGAGVANDGQIFTTWFFGGADVSYPIMYLDSRYSRKLNREGLYSVAEKVMQYDEAQGRQ